MIQIVPVVEAHHLDLIKSLFTTYAQWRGFDAALGDFQQELDGLPGKYAFPKGALLLALSKDQAAGCIAYQALSSEICEMKRMFVLEKFRKQGLGRKLIQRLIDEAKKSGYIRMRLDTHPHMTSAQHLYKDMGFTEIDRYNQNPTPGIRFFELILT